ncbi:manganese efflux pump MntP family protein [Jeotgalibacillus soli]|uniref:Putative manganese efflux pump MntP n=1 Tax=Jeotgalibacillus soli TaxID=889306 RepID=A0A0C2VLG2_9BACL|nr:manganese efflux pump MntP family protein [Jeotgalibacillus soli]KIL49757.1 hypothetical protein KP78_12250 [Jeotgalibacillus soli]
MGGWSHEIHLIVWLALGLGMDAFSASIAIGTQNLRHQQKWFGSIVVGVFHMIMPLIGMLVGSFLSDSVSWLGGALLLAVGAQMIRSGLKGRAMQVASFTGGKWVLFAFGVSIDSLSVGVTLGIKHMSIVVSILLFGICATLMTRLGLQLGQVLKHSIGRYSEVVGGSILLAIALRMLISG